MTNTLVEAVDLFDFPGAPFEDALVDAAVADIRAEAGWHIAPVITETLTVDCYGGTLLVLPTRRIVAVTAIRDMSNGGAVLAGWTRMTAGIYRNRGFQGWPIGSLEVDLSHGFAATPLDLLPVVVNRVRNAANPRDPGLASRSTSRGPFSESESYRNGGSTAVVDPVVARYAVPGGVA